MLRRWGRILVAFATALAAWVVASPAYAAAPLCDDRGAITFAPAPQIQAPETSIDTGAAPDEDCLGLSMLRALHEGGAPTQIATAPALQDVMVPSHLSTPAPSWSVAPVPRDVLARGPTGVRGSVDRPPRP